jgi:hypothetical protein
MRITILLILPIVIAAAVGGLWFLFRSFASRDGAQGIGLFTMVVGAIGIIVPLLVLMGNSSANIQIAVLISGAIIFGCGSIATAIGTKKK